MAVISSGQPAAKQTPPPDPVTQPLPLPPLREDLVLLKGAPSSTGEPTWTIHDPLANRYYRIGATGFEMLAYWSCGNSRNLIATLKDKRGLSISKEQFSQFLGFLQKSSLIIENPEQEQERLLKTYNLLNKSWYKTILHTYLFFKIPVFHPDNFLKTVQPYVAFFYRTAFWWWVAFFGGAGIILTARQFDTFISYIPDQITPTGIALFTGALALAKILHEFGHACTARHYRCRVPVMGVAFLLLWPILYTDTTNAWRLTSSRQRLLIGAAGIIVELTLALLATFAWAVTPDGGLRSAFFALASITWISSLMINLNPFMRFDGYYLLADSLDEPNLQDRSFLLAKWHLREFLFGYGDPKPGNFPYHKQKALIVYAYGVWIYRFFLFLGIALIVYAFFLKIVGIFLFAVEIIWFIARPIYNEMKVWVEKRKSLCWNKATVRTTLLLALFTGVLIFPWQSEVRLQAIHQAQQAALITTKTAGKVARHHLIAGKPVNTGDELLLLTNESTTYRARIATLEVASLQEQVARAQVSDDSLSELPILQENLTAALTNLANTQEFQDLLVLRAPHNGILRDIYKDIEPGQWLKDGFILGSIINPDRGEVISVITEDDLNRIGVESPATFYPDDINRPSIDLSVREINFLNMVTVDIPYFALPYGGSVNVKPEIDAANMIPDGSYYQVRLTAEGLTAPSSIVPGHVLIKAERRSIAGRIMKNALSVLIRESNF
ncbi:MAG: site-2 protease family protein [Pseudomonadota bacterium]